MGKLLKIKFFLGVLIVIFITKVNAQIYQDQIKVRKIWGNEHHNAFGDLLMFEGNLYCSFRSGTDHVGGADGIVHIIKSNDGENWEILASLKKQGYDLRDPKLSVTPDGKIMVTIGGSVYKDKELVSRLTHISFSNKSGTEFSDPQPVNIDEKFRTGMDWIWRVSWHKNTGYGVVYSLPRKISLLKTVDGINYDLIKEFDDISDGPSETTVRVMPDGEMFMLVRRASVGGLWGRSKPPYKDWNWVDTGMRLGGPDFAVLNNDLFIAGTRVYQDSQYTGIFVVNRAGKFRKILRLPSGGDNSYPGFVVKDKIYVSYYSSHEGNSSIYLAEIPFTVIEEVRKAPPVVESVKIWNDAHSAFTDLIRFKGKFYCAFREGKSHAGGDHGSIRVITSSDGSTWTSAALIEEEGIDLRDPKLSVMPNGKLMLICGGSDYDGKTLIDWHTRVVYSTNGMEWTRPLRVKGIPSNNWFFGITWLGDTGYVAPRICRSDPETGSLVQENTRIIIYKTGDGINYEQVSGDISVNNFQCHGGCGEAVIQFKKDSSMVVLVRSRITDHYKNISEKGVLLFSTPPYKEFRAVNIQHGLGGPVFMPFNDNLWLIGTREIGNERPEGRDGDATVLLLVDKDGIYKRLYEFPSGGDTSYPGMVIYDERLWFSYYSSHEGVASVYLSVIPLTQISP